MDWSQIALGLVFVLFLIVSLAMILIVLVQKPQGGGLSGAFGGGGGDGAGQTAFGARTGDALTTVTVGIFIVFLGTAIALNFMMHQQPAAANTTQNTQQTSGAGGAGSTEGEGEATENAPVNEEGISTGTFQPDESINVPEAGDAEPVTPPGTIGPGANPGTPSGDSE